MTTLYSSAAGLPAMPARIIRPARSIGDITADLWRCIALLNDGHVHGESRELHRLQDRAEELVELWAIQAPTDCERRDAEEIIAHVREWQEIA